MKRIYIGCCKKIYILLIFLSHQSFAQTLPDAGSIFRDIEKKIDTENIKSIPLEMPIKEEHPTPVTSSNSEIKFILREFKIDGNTVFEEEILQKLVRSNTGIKYSLKEIEDIIMNITKYYWDNGYSLAYAYIPPQDIKDGIVKVSIVEGHYGRIKVDNGSDAKNELIDRYILAEKQKYPIVHRERLERLLNILKDAANSTEVKSSLSAGSESKTSDLLIKVGASPKIIGKIEGNNYGTDSTGKYNFEGSLLLNNPLGLGDRINTKILTSAQGQDFFSIGYNLPVGDYGWRFGTSYSSSTYKVGGDFKSLDAYGYATKWMINANYPFQRLQNKSLYLDINVNRKKLDDIIGKVDSSSHKFLTSESIGLNGHYNINDISNIFYNMSFDVGQIETKNRQKLPVVESHQEASFSKLSYTFFYQHFLNYNLAVSLNVNGQKTLDNLDSSEKISLGGPYGVRAYNMGEASGDSGYIANFELQYFLPFPLFSGRTKLNAFLDAGRSSINSTSLSDSSNKRDVTGIGVGLTWQHPNNYILQFIYAIRTRSNTLSTQSNPESRSWITLSKGF